MGTVNRKILEQVLASPKLPSLPRIAVDVLALCRSEDSNVGELAALIRQDPALVMKLLQTVNTSAFGLGRSVSTVEEATKMLGLKSIQTLALAFCLSNAMTDQCGDAFEMDTFWRRSVYAAAAAQEIARTTRACDPHEAFTAGLLEDIGVLAMACTIGGPYLQITKVAGRNHSALDRLERKNLRVSHAVVGAMLAQHWNLGPTLVSAIRYHHEPRSAPAEQRAVCACAALGSIAADVLLPDQMAMAATARWFEAMNEHFALDRDHANVVLTAADAHARSIAGQFNLSPTPKRDLAAILTDANQRLVELALASQETSRRLETQRDEMHRRATRDALTGLANRAAFDDFLDQQLALNKPFALILIDLDKFKEVNDIHGHVAGDLVLQDQAELLTALAPPGALAARYGGEEFAVILPDADVVGGARLAEALRQERAERAVDINADASLVVTLSAGVAAHGPGIPGDPLTAAELINLADRALYNAKNHGRNAIRMVRPQPASQSA
ncbi:MAG: GGDEF domain-containing protein [Planctomycetota bacterium]